MMCFTSALEKHHEKSAFPRGRFLPTRQPASSVNTYWGKWNPMPMQSRGCQPGFTARAVYFICLAVSNSFTSSPTTLQPPHLSVPSRQWLCCSHSHDSHPTASSHLRKEYGFAFGGGALTALPAPNVVATHRQKGSLKLLLSLRMLGVTLLAAVTSRTTKSQARERSLCKERSMSLFLCQSGWQHCIIFPVAAICGGSGGL